MHDNNEKQAKEFTIEKPQESVRKENGNVNVKKLTDDDKIHYLAIKHINFALVS
jgi:hypothetical protein